MTIVIVDDSVTNLIVLRSLSTSASNVPAIGFSDPEAAVKYLECNEADAIVVDYSMPKMNGIQLTNLIRSMPNHYATPIIMVTHATDYDTRMCALQAGATAFLSKPVVAAEFKNLVLKVISQKLSHAVIIGDTAKIA